MSDKTTITAMIRPHSSPQETDNGGAFLSGITARILGWSIDDCPIKADHPALMQQWQEGWLSMGVRPID